MVVIIGENDDVMAMVFFRNVSTCALAIFPNGVELKDCDGSCEEVKILKSRIYLFRKQ